MELLYIWIEKYSIIENQGFNFGREYEFSYDPDTNKLSKNKRKYTIPKDFFGKNITNITAIVGKNGSGKTTVLDFLKNINGKGEYLSSKKFLLVFKYDNNLYFENYLEKDIIPPKYILENQKILELRNTYLRDDKINFSKIFYSNSIFSTLDISGLTVSPYKYNRTFTNPLMGNMLEEAQIYQKMNHLLFLNKTAKNHEYLENNPLLNFINKIDKIELKMTKVNFLDIKKNIKLFEIYQNFMEILKEKKENEIQCKIYENNTNYIFNKLTKLRNYNDLKLTYVANVNSSFEKSFKEFIKLVEESVKYDNYFYAEYFDQFKINMNKDKSCFFNFKNKKYNIENFYSNNLVIGIDFFKDAEEEDLRLLMDQYDIKMYPSLSQGEECLLDLFSSLRNNIKNMDNQPPVILGIDEGESNFHPEWQRRYLKMLCAFINQNFDKRKFNIILTSHSPFIASDLPKENVIMLEKSEDGKCTVKDNDMKTFGANIFNLYKEAFFVESSFGEFAKEKIQYVAKKLEEKKYYEHKEEIDFIVNSIGEPLIKNKLLGMVKENQKNEDRIRVLEQEIARLKGEKND